MVPGGGQMSAFRESPVPVRDPAALTTSILLLLIAAVAWVDVIRSSLGAPDMMMTMFMPPTVADGLAFVASWGIMMAAMMLPSALPMIILYGATLRAGDATAPRGVPVAVFTLLYLSVWTASGVPVYLAHTGLMALSPRTFAYGVAAIFFAAGIFQLSPLKQTCLRACRSPLGFLLGHWRAGLRGSLVLGWSHAMFCLGCCWVLMVVLVAAGAMGLAWVLLITAVVAAEKLLPGGEWMARATGFAFLLLGVAVALRPDLVTALRGGHVM
jgi:predicted metal-binding membrane protein